MIKTTSRFTVIFLLLFAISSCGYMARELFAGKKCQTCEIRDESNTVVWSETECGGGVFNMELKAKARAYDLGCNHTLTCDKFKKSE